MLANELDTYQLVNHSINNVILVTPYLIKLTDVRLSLFSKARKTRSYTQRVCFRRTRDAVTRTYLRMAGLCSPPISSRLWVAYQRIPNRTNAILERIHPEVTYQVDGTRHERTIPGTADLNDIPHVTH